jgi:hypothetical protein
LLLPMLLLLLLLLLLLWQWLLLLFGQVVGTVKIVNCLTCFHISRLQNRAAKQLAQWQARGQALNRVSCW